jgi:hypothetical protein
MAYYIICITFSAAKLSPSEKSHLGSQPENTRKLLSIVKSKVRTSCEDEIMTSTLTVLWSLACEFLHS